MTTKTLIKLFKDELFRLGLLLEVHDIKAIQGLIQFTYEENEWRIPFVLDEMETIQSIETADEFIEYLNENCICNDDFDLDRVLENSSDFMIWGG